MEMKKKEIVAYDSLIAGLLLIFNKIDSTDFSLLVRDFENKTLYDLRGSLLKNIREYVKYSANGTISLKDGLSLDDYIEIENKTIRQIFLELLDPKVDEYIKNFDIKKYMAKKEKMINHAKDIVTNNANVLLISDIEEDYEELKKFGFKKIDYFKSVIRANSYFINHPEELKKYNIIFKGSQRVKQFHLYGRVELDNMIESLDDKNHLLVCSLDRYNYSDHIELCSYLEDKKTSMMFEASEKNYESFFNRIIENILINKIKVGNKKFTKIDDVFVERNLPLPNKKSHLKILYLDAIRVSDFAQKVKDDLQLDITFMEDNNSSLGKYVKDALGKYDIIIASKMYSNALLRMNVESTEQCKDTGRKLTLLVCYDNDYYGFINNKYGFGIRLDYTFGGKLATTSELNSKQFRAPRYPLEIDKENEYIRKYIEKEYSQIRAAIESSVNFYNDELVNAGQKSIDDLDYKSCEEFEMEYLSADDSEKKMIEEELIPIKLFDSIRDQVTLYLMYKEKGLIKKIPQSLRITNYGKEVKIDNLYQGKILCSIIFQRYDNQKGIRLFQIQMQTKKGTLSNPQMVGEYLHKYDSIDGIPPRPDEKQKIILESTLKKINLYLSPLNQEAMHFQTEKERAFSLKKSNKKINQ